MDQTLLYNLCHGIPKIELHCHLFGTVRKTTMMYLNNKAGKPLTDQELNEFYVRGEKPVGVLRILRALDKYLIRTEDDLYRLTTEYLEDAHSHNVRYSEFFWNPTGTVKVSCIEYHKAQGAIVAAIRDSEKRLGIKSRLIISIDREESPESAIEMVLWMTKYRAPEVVGIGIDYREELGPPEKFIEAYRCAKQAGFRATAHAGEFGCRPKNIEVAINHLNVDRIDHGYTVLEDDSLTKECLDRKFVFTVVPTNSYYLRTLTPEDWERKHPIRLMVQRGLRVFPNTDDPAFHQVTPTKAWMMMVEHFGCTISDLKKCLQYSIEAAWIDEFTRETWMQEWPSYFDAFLK